MSKDLLRTEGVALLREAFPIAALLRIRAAAATYTFQPFSYSVTLEDFAGVDLAPLRVDDLLSRFIDQRFECRLGDSWVRKRFAPANAPREYRPNSWHQDGALRAHFDPQSKAVGPINQMTTLWIPLQDCGMDAPALEFVRQPLDHLLHYEDLTDAAVRDRFPSDFFWSPNLHFGDAVIFGATTLHRTHVTPTMHQDRFSIEFRAFLSSPLSFPLPGPVAEEPKTSI